MKKLFAALIACGALAAYAPVFAADSKGDEQKSEKSKADEKKSSKKKKGGCG